MREHSLPLPHLVDVDRGDQEIRVYVHGDDAVQAWLNSVELVSESNEQWPSNVVFGPLANKVTMRTSYRVLLGPGLRFVLVQVRQAPDFVAPALSVVAGGAS